MRQSLVRGRQAVFFTTANPMDDGYGMGETPCDLTKPRIAPCKNTWIRFQNTVCWCNLNSLKRKTYNFTIHAVFLYNTIITDCIEKAVCMKTQDELYQKVRLTPRVPRVVLKSNSQCEQDSQSQDARSSWEPSSDRKSYGETCNSTVDHRISGVPLSAVEQQDTTRENKAQKLIEKFENHKNKDSLIQDLSQTEKDQQVQQRIEGLDRRLEQHGDLRTWRKFFQAAMS